MNTEDISLLFQQWNQQLQTGDPKQVTALYDPEAILIPTISNQVRHNHREIEDYFSHFLRLAPQGEIQESNIRIFDDIAINSGTYRFQFNDGSSANARYTFVYRRKQDNWLIIEHHSSKMPE